MESYQSENGLNGLKQASKVYASQTETRIKEDPKTLKDLRLKNVMGFK